MCVSVGGWVFVCGGVWSPLTCDVIHMCTSLHIVFSCVQTDEDAITLGNFMDSTMYEFVYISTCKIMLPSICTFNHAFVHVRI